MKMRFVGLLVTALAWPGFALAQSTAAQVQDGFLTTVGCLSGQTTCWKPWSTTTPLPVNGPVSATASATPTAVLAGPGVALNTDLFSGLFTAIEFAGQIVDGSHGLPINCIAGCGSVTGIAAISSAAAEGSHVLKNAAGTLSSVYVTAGAAAGYLMIFNATSAPGDGAVTPVHCIPVAANQANGLSFGSGPPGIFSTGITAVFSTTGCFTKTASATAFFVGNVQ